MAKYKSYIHVERLGRTETEGILNGKCYIFPKLDGTNAVMFWDEKPQCGSRKRQLNKNKDNAGFYQWFNGASNEAIDIRKFVTENPHLIVYGEYGLNRVGQIKYYDDAARNKVWIFDVFDTNAQRYLTYPELVDAFAPYNSAKECIVPCLAILENPTETMLLTIAQEKNEFLLTESRKQGEGIVIKNYNYQDSWGNYQVGKLVLDEFKERKNKGNVISIENIEQEIVDRYVTDAELSKTLHKVLTLLKLPQADIKNSKFVGCFIALVWKDLLSENICDIVKRLKNPTINFSKLKMKCDKKARKFIGL